MDKESIMIILLKLFIKDSLKIIKKMDMAYWNSHKTNIIMECLINLLKMDMAYKNLLMVINIKANIKWASFMEKANIHGLMGRFIKVILFKVWGMVMVIGNLLRKILIFMLGCIKMIKSQV